MQIDICKRQTNRQKDNSLNLVCTSVHVASCNQICLYTISQGLPLLTYREIIQLLRNLTQILSAPRSAILACILQGSITISQSAHFFPRLFRQDQLHPTPPEDPMEGYVHRHTIPTFLCTYIIDVVTILLLPILFNLPSLFNGFQSYTSGGRRGGGPCGEVCINTLPIRELLLFHAFQLQPSNLIVQQVNVFTLPLLVIMKQLIMEKTLQ